MLEEKEFCYITDDHYCRNILVFLSKPCSNVLTSWYTFEIIHYNINATLHTDMIVKCLTEKKLVLKSLHGEHLKS